MKDDVAFFPSMPESQQEFMLRDFFAAEAMWSILPGCPTSFDEFLSDRDPQRVADTKRAMLKAAEACYWMADAMVEARKAVTHG